MSHLIKRLDLVTGDTPEDVVATANFEIEQGWQPLGAPYRVGERWQMAIALMVDEVMEEPKAVSTITTPEDDDTINMVCGLCFASSEDVPRYLHQTTQAGVTASQASKWLKVNHYSIYRDYYFPNSDLGPAPCDNAGRL